MDDSNPVNFWVQVTLLSGDCFKRCSELLFWVLEDRQKRKEDSVSSALWILAGSRMSPPVRPSDRSYGAGKGPACPQTPFVAASTGSVAAAVSRSSCSFCKGFILGHPWPPFRSLLPSTMFLFSNTKNSALSLTFPSSLKSPQES